MLTIHGRTKRELSIVPANWEALQHIRELRDKLSPVTKIVGNGDVRDRAHGEELAAKHGLDGVMIGRGVFTDPYCFSTDSPWEQMSAQEKVELFKRHAELHLSTYPNGERKFEPLKKFVKMYINGFDGSKDLREKIMECRSAVDLLTVLNTSLQAMQ